MLKRFWTSKFTTITFLLVAALGLVLSVALTFGQPSSTKVILRLSFTLLFATHLLTVYPTFFKKLLFGTEGRVLPSIKFPRLTDSFYLPAIGILIISFFARLYRVTEFLTVDESKWLVTRVPTFFSELTAFNWQNLLISDKPGITLAWLVKIGLLFTDKEGSYEFMSTPELLLAGRLPLIIANIALLFGLAILVKRVMNSNMAALLFLALTATNPNIMGMATIVNPDSIGWFFPLATLLLFFLYLRDRRPWDLALVSLVFAGGALNKFNALVVLPFLPLFAVLYFIFAETKPQDFFRFAAKATARLYILAWGISTVLWPYLLLAPQQYLKQTLLRPVIKPLFIPIMLSLIIFALFGDTIGTFLTRWNSKIKRSVLISVPAISLILIAVTFWLTPGTPGLPSVEKGTNVEAPFIDLVFSNYYYHLYSQTTLTLALYLIATIFVVSYAFRLKKADVFQSLSVVSLLFILSYLAGSAATGHITSPRYQIPVFPVVSLLIATTIIPWIETMGRKRLLMSGVAVATVVSFALVIPFAPYYLFYNNHLLPKGKLVFDGWGLGGYEAAQFLNKLPDAKKLTVYASYPGFSGFFKGQSLGMKEDPFSRTVDYMVIFKQSDNRIIVGDDPVKNQLWRHDVEADFELVYNGVAVVKVVKVGRNKNLEL